MQSSWVFGLSFDFFLEFWVFFLEFFCPKPKIKPAICLLVDNAPGHLLNKQKNFSYTTYFSLGSPHPTPTRITNPTRSTDIWAMTKKSVELVLNCTYKRIDENVEKTSKADNILSWKKSPHLKGDANLKVQSIFKILHAPQFWILAPKFKIEVHAKFLNY